jgi:hypothetical protein
MLPFGKTQKRKIALQRRSVTRSQFNSRTCRGQNCPRCRHVPPHRGLSPRRNPHSCGTAYVPPPRFRALALFGRRPPERVDRFDIPASENQHRSRLTRCKKHRNTFACNKRSRRDEPGDEVCRVRPQFTGAPSGARAMISIRVPQGIREVILLLPGSLTKAA